jgi:hypothetical protein
MSQRSIEVAAQHRNAPKIPNVMHEWAFRWPRNVEGYADVRTTSKSSSTVLAEDADITNGAPKKGSTTTLGGVGFRPPNSARNSPP